MLHKLQSVGTECCCCQSDWSRELEDRSTSHQCPGSSTAPIFVYWKIDKPQFKNRPTEIFKS